MTSTTCLVPRAIAKALATATTALAAGKVDTCRRAMVYAAAAMGMSDVLTMGMDQEFALRLLSAEASRRGDRRAEEKALHLRNARA
jgi:uncharacterized caspase-like protein